MVNGTKALISTVPTFQATALVKGLVKFTKKKKKAGSREIERENTEYYEELYE